MGMEDGDQLPVDAVLLRSSMFVGDVIAGHGPTPFLEAAEAAGCRTANGGHTVEAAQDVMADFMLGKADSSTGVTATLQQGDRAGPDLLGPVPLIDYPT
jgi:shikimate 5-dehydrogenase